MARFLGVDPGDARTGVAISDEMNFMAHPLETITNREVDPVHRIAKIVEDKKITTIVVGMPRNMDGSYGPAAEKTRVFIEKLESAGVGCPVVAWDERLSTVAAQRSMREAGRSAKNQRGVIDQAAAQIILQSWMDGPGAMAAGGL